MKDMNSFLSLVADDLYSRFAGGENGLSRVTVVFPNRRARLFFDGLLAQCSDKPLWAPSYTTIQDLFQSRSDLQLADRIELISLLHQVYCQVMQSDESLDDFWPWGEIMLADFDDVDRNLAHATEMFRLLSQQKEMTDLSFLTDQQNELLESFFGKLKETENTRLKQQLTTVWSNLGEIHQRFVALLESRGLAYSGMMQRRVTERLANTVFDADCYAFVGFNSLDGAEKALFQAINQAGKGLFYWDYDISYVKDEMHEAGHFMRENLRLFPSALPEDKFDNLSKDRKLTIVETRTDNAQACYVPDWIRNTGKDKADSSMAVVLCDESLLQPVLHCLPSDCVGDVNITMGFPMSDTPLFSLISALIDMQRSAARHDGRFVLENVAKVLSNPLVSGLSPHSLELLSSLRKNRIVYPSLEDLDKYPELSMLFCRAYDRKELLDWLLDVLKGLLPVVVSDSQDSLFKPMNQEALFRCYTQTNRFRSMISDGKLNLQTDTMVRLLESVLSQSTVPFHGEPVLGMQVMGLLETRNLDFKHVLLLSAGEGTLPGASASASFIPYNIRLAFGLSSSQDKSAVVSYNFHHLLQRAESVTMVYNGNPDSSGMSKGQISRYLLQLLLSGKQVEQISLQAERSDAKGRVLSVEKNAVVLEQLVRKYDVGNPKAYLSPSALKKYLTCPLSFYLAQVAGLRKPENAGGGIDMAMFGTILHKSAELIYEQLAENAADRVIDSSAVESVLKSKDTVPDIVCRAFRECYFNNTDVALQDYCGTQTVVHGVICKYLRQILRIDGELYAPFRYIRGESDEYGFMMAVDDPCHEGQTLNVRLKGIIDRMDEKDGITRIVDYKTGKHVGFPKNMDALFDRNGMHEHAFQIFYYALVLSKQKQFAGKRIAPTLLYTRTTSKPKADDLYYRIGDHQVLDFVTLYGNDFEKRLQSVIQEIFNPDIPFSPVSDSPGNSVCSRCDFHSLCFPGCDKDRR